jgi:hypothetical protein
LFVGATMAAAICSGVMEAWGLSSVDWRFQRLFHRFYPVGSQTVANEGRTFLQTLREPRC